VPVVAVIPALVACADVVAVKTLTVDLRSSELVWGSVILRFVGERLSVKIGEGGIKVGPSRWVNPFLHSYFGPPFSLVSNAGHQNPCQFYLRAHHNAELIGTGGEIHLNWCCIRSGVAKNLRVGTAARLVIQVLLSSLKRGGV